MATVTDHYDKLLSEVYSWMLGGFETAIPRNEAFLKEHDLSPSGSGIAFDLGAGCGFQSIPLARAGYDVTAIDLDARLLSELDSHRGQLPIRTIRDDLVNFDSHLRQDVEVIVCMTDTILHLESQKRVALLFDKAYAALEIGGKCVLTFRDLTGELDGLDRFVPVKSDESTVFTCFLEYEPETVKVHDLVYRRSGGKWDLHKSFYRKLRLPREWVETKLSSCGFSRIDSQVNQGAVTIVAVK
jgi:hypothetical protein